MNNGNDQSEVVPPLQDGREWISQRLARVDKEARSFLTEHPFLSLACAVGIGYLAARLLRERK